MASELLPLHGTGVAKVKLIPSKIKDNAVHVGHLPAPQLWKVHMLFPTVPFTTFLNNSLFLAHLHLETEVATVVGTTMPGITQLPLDNSLMHPTHTLLVLKVLLAHAHPSLHKDSLNLSVKSALPLTPLQSRMQFT
jgi:hypothetical protein